jgi:hypothetical protein
VPGPSALWLLPAAALVVGAAAWLRPDGPSPTAAPPVRSVRLHADAAPARAFNAPQAGRADDNRARAAAPPEEESVADEPVVEVQTGQLPELLGRHDLEAGMEKVRAAVGACAEVEHYAGVATVRIVIAPTGAVQAVSVLPPLDETETGACVSKAVRAATFPRFRGTVIPTVELTYPFMIGAPPAAP